MITKGMMTSNTDDWATPIDLFKEIDETYHFTLDVCASPENAKCDRYFTKELDGLSQEWTGVCWCNPPYGREIGKWVKKAVEAQRNGTTVVMLLPARTDTKWFHDYIYNAPFGISFIKGRLKFNDGKNPAPFPSMLVFMHGAGLQKHLNDLRNRPR